MNKERVFSWMVAAAGVATLVMWAGSARAKHYGSGLSMHSHGAINTCDDLDFTFEDQEAVRGEDHFNVPKSAAPLYMTAAENGGLEVVGWDGNGYDITACKAAAGQDFLSQISVSIHGARVTAEGPAEREWTVYFIIKAPNDSALRVEAKNGPISLRADRRQN